MRSGKKCYFIILILSFFILANNSISNYNISGDISTSSFLATDFSDFTLKKGTNYIETKNFGDEFTFFYNGSGEERQNKYYWLHFDGQYNNFEVEVTIDYNYNGLWFGHFYFNLKSFYSESGELLETTDGTAYCQATFADMWTGSGGVFTGVGWPNDMYDPYQSAYGVTSNSGTAKFILTKNDDGVIVSVIKDEILQIQHTWTYGLTRPVNELAFGGYFYNNISYHNVGNFSLTLRDFSANFTTPYNFTTSFPPFTSIALPGFTFNIGITGFVLTALIYFIYRKRRK